MLRFLFLFLTSLFVLSYSQENKFDTRYQWSHINFTWNSIEEYEEAISSKRYIPEHNALVGIKFYKDMLYVALPRILEGTPVTLASLNKSESLITNPLLKPYPSWEMNAGTDCSSIQNVQSMEIDENGIMWVLDGSRFNNFTDCPPKLVLLDLNKNGAVVHSYIFPNEVCLWNGGFLNDLVLDGDFAYITETSEEPGLIVYSRSKDKSLKLLDKTMLPEPDAIDFVVDGWPNRNAVPIDGIAISPKTDEKRIVYYTALTGFSMYSIEADVLKNELLYSNGTWENYTACLGEKLGQSDGMVMDKHGTLYYGVLNLYGIGVWNKNEPFNTTSLIYSNNSTIKWPDSFGFDEDGVLYVLANNIHKYFDPTYPHELNDEIKFRILGMFGKTTAF